MATWAGFRNGKEKRPAALCHRASTERSLQLGGDGRERRSQVGADRAEHSHSRDRNQGGDQAVLDGCRSVFVLQEFGETRKHRGFSRAVDRRNMLAFSFKTLKCLRLIRS